MLSRLRIGPRLALAMGLTLSIFLITLAVLWVAMGEHVSQSERVQTQSLPLMLAAEHMVLDVSQVQQFLTDVSATRDRQAYAEAATYAADFLAGVETFKRHFVSTGETAKVREMDELARRFRSFYALGKDMAEAYVTRGVDAGNRIMRTFDRQSTDLQEAMDQFETHNHRQTRIATSAVVSSAHLMQTLILLCGLFGLLVGMIISRLTVRSITQPISQAVAVAESVAAGNLSHPIHAHGTDELAQLLRSMARMQANLHHLLASSGDSPEWRRDDTDNAWRSAEQNLRQTARELEDLYQNAPCGYHTLDADGQFLRINNTELDWLGYSRLELLNKIDLKSILTDASRVRFERGYAQLVRNGDAFELELECVRKDGSTLPVQASASAVLDEDGHFVLCRSTVHDLTERKRQEQERAEQARHIETLSRNLIAVQEQERRKISSELHDHTGANLTALDTFLKIITTRLPQPLPTSLEKVVGDARHVLADTIASVRTICSELRPVILDYAGLVPALESYAQSFERRSGVRVRFRATPVAGLSAEVESNLFRIAQEALTNCAKYAQAKHLSLDLEGSATRLRLSIADDGIGFSPQVIGQDASPHLGLVTMRERSEFIGGRFDLVSAPGRGTRIEVVIDRV